MTKIYILKDGEGGIEDVFDSEEKLIKKVGKEIWDNKTKYTGYGQTAWEDDVFELGYGVRVSIGELK